ncbi:hypothetical protein EV361DRAFT_1034979 [Lentinula raphanica]|nr:hypothetical protein EV361DRAFT_1034979 [Lentinula raphanica]
MPRKRSTRVTGGRKKSTNRSRTKGSAVNAPVHPTPADPPVASFIDDEATVEGPPGNFFDSSGDEGPTSRAHPSEDSYEIGSFVVADDDDDNGDDDDDKGDDNADNDIAVMSLFSDNDDLSPVPSDFDIGHTSNVPIANGVAPSSIKSGSVGPVVLVPAASVSVHPLPDHTAPVGHTYVRSPSFCVSVSPLTVPQTVPRNTVSLDTVQNTDVAKPVSTPQNVPMYTVPGSLVSTDSASVSFSVPLNAIGGDSSVSVTDPSDPFHGDSVRPPTVYTLPFVPGASASHPSSCAKSVPSSCANVSVPPLEISSNKEYRLLGASSKDPALHPSFSHVLQTSSDVEHRPQSPEKYHSSHFTNPSTTSPSPGIISDDEVATPLSPILSPLSKAHNQFSVRARKQIIKSPSPDLIISSPVPNTTALPRVIPAVAPPVQNLGQQHSQSSGKRHIDDDSLPHLSAFRTPEKRRRNTLASSPRVLDQSSGIPPSSVTLFGRTYVAVVSPDPSAVASSHKDGVLSSPLSVDTSSRSFLLEPQSSQPLPPSCVFPTSSVQEPDFNALDIDLPDNYRDIPGLRTPSPVGISSSSVFATPSSSPSKSSTYTLTPPSSLVSSSPGSSARSTPIRAPKSRFSPYKTPTAAGDHRFSACPPSAFGRAKRRSAIELALLDADVDPSPSFSPSLSLSVGAESCNTAPSSLSKSTLPFPSPSSANSLTYGATPHARMMPMTPLHGVQSSYNLHSPSVSPTRSAPSPQLGTPVYTESFGHNVRPAHLPATVHASSRPPALFPVSISPLPSSIHNTPVAGSSTAPGNHMVPVNPTSNLPSVPSANPPFLNAELGPDGCLNVEWIDPRLAPHFQSVENLPSVTLRPATDDPPSEADDFLPLDAVLEGLDPTTTSCVLSCLNFTSFGVFVNPCRIAPFPMLMTEPAGEGKLRSVPVASVSNYGTKTIYTMVGKVSSCSIYTPLSTPPREGRTRYIRSVKVIGLLQDAQYLAAHFGELFGCKVMICLASNGEFEFRTFFRSDRDPDTLAPTVDLPVSRKKLTPINSTGTLLWPFPHFKDTLPFPHIVPIFDGRGIGQFPPFSSQPWELSRIGQRSYPLYNGGLTDLPANSTVSVGFTAHVWTPETPTHGIKRSLSFSIQYLVLLALPASSSHASKSSNSQGTSANVVYYQDLYN